MTEVQPRRELDQLDDQPGANLIPHKLTCKERLMEVKKTLI